MINPNDSIRCTNVVSKKYRYPYKEMGDALADFNQRIVGQGASVKGPFFYSINNVPMEKVVHGEFFLPIHQDRIRLADGMSFHSYFSIENMISDFVLADFEKYMEVSYRILIDYMKDRHLRQATPIFHVLSGDAEMPYIHVKIGVMPEDNRAVWR